MCVKRDVKISTFKKAVTTFLVASNLFFNAPAFAKDKPLVQQISKSSEARSSQKSEDQQSQSKCKIIEPIRADNMPDSKKYDFVEQALYIADIASPTSAKKYFKRGFLGGFKGKSPLISIG